MVDFTIRFLVSNLFLGIFVGILAVLKWLFRKTLSGRMQYHLWFLLFFLLPIPFLPVRSFSLAAQISSFLGAVSPDTLSHPVPPGSTPLSSAFSDHSAWADDFALSVSRQTPSIIWQILFFFWCAGIIVMLLLFIRSVRQLKHFTRSALLLENAEILSLYNDCLKEFNITRKIPLYTTAYLSSPAMTGLFRPRIYLPLHLVSDCPKADLRYMFLHELQHYRQKDILVSLFMNLASIFYWFHPALWYAFRELHTDREIACDTAVLELLGETSCQNYGETLINFAEQLSRTPFSFATNLGGSMRQMKRRVQNIASYQPFTRWKKAKGYTLVLIIVLLFTGFAPALSTQATEEMFFQPKINPEQISTLNLSSYFEDYTGTFVLYDLKNDHYQIYNPAQACKRVSPDSTYKVYSALFGLEERIITPEHSSLPWDHQSYPFSVWNKDHDLTSAMSASVNWYFQTIDQALGADTIHSYLEKIHYGNEAVSSSASYWMESSLKISAWEQVLLLTDFYQNSFSFDAENILAVKDSLRLMSLDGKTLSGKTGTGNINGQNVNGWFIGYVESTENTFFFAVNIHAEENASGSVASEIAFSILNHLGIWDKTTPSAAAI